MTDFSKSVTSMDVPTRHRLCINKKAYLCKYNCNSCFSRSFAASANAHLWHESNTEEPRNICGGSEKIYTFHCDTCKHTFESAVKNVRKSGCPYCAVPCRKMCFEKDCNVCFDKSFASIAFQDFWSEENEVTPREIFKGTHVKYEFICSKDGCGHKFMTAPHKIVAGCRCPYCSKGGRKLCEDKTCEICIPTSFSRHPKADFWSSKNDGNPADYTFKTRKKFLFDCPECNHEFSISLGHIVADNRWCPYCAVPSKKVCENKSCERCFKRSFASCPKSKFWSKKNPDKPRDLLLHSHEKRIFDCENCGGEYNSVLYSVVAGRGCSDCFRKTEFKLHKWLKENYPNRVKKEAKFDWCRNPDTGRHFPFDFVIEDEKLIIELDGAQHFIQVQNWAPPEQTQARDRYKENLANEHGYTVVRLLQEEVIIETEESNQIWQNALEEFITRKRNMPNVVAIESGKEIRIPKVPIIFGDDC